jgi:hypothetical protein
MVKAAHPTGDVHQGVLGIHPPRPRSCAAHRLARQECQHLPSLLINSQRPRAAGKSLTRQVRQQRLHRWRPRPGGPPDGIPNPGRPAGIASIQANLHLASLPTSSQRGHPDMPRALL